jgi:hypothetical protein
MVTGVSASTTVVQALFLVLAFFCCDATSASMGPPEFAIYAKGVYRGGPSTVKMPKF